MGTSWITPKEDWAAGDGPSSVDFNRIENNIDYIRNQDATFTGSKSFSANTDEVFTFGRGKMGYNSADSNRFTISHYLNHNATDYGLQLTGTDTFLNTKSGGTLYFRENDTNLMTVESDAITMYEPLTLSGDLNFQGNGDGIFSPNVTTGFLAISSGSSESDGANIILRGSSSGLGKTIDVRVDSVATARFFESGNVGFGSNPTDNGVDGIQAWEDTDKSFVFGRAKLGYATSGSTDHMYLAHYNRFTSTDYAFRQNSAGTTYVNANSSASVRIMSSNSAVSVFESDAITMYEPLTVKISSSETTGIGIYRPISTQSATVRLGFYHDDNNASKLLCGDIRVFKAVTTLGAESADMHFHALTAGTMTEYVRLKGATGNFLIGTSSDNGTDKLQVNGSGYFSDDLTVDGNFLPTDSPTESTISHSVSPSNTEEIDILSRGIYHIYVSSPSNAVACCVEKLINGTWRTLYDESNDTIATDLLASSGADLRVRSENQFGGTGTGTYILHKH